MVGKYETYVEPYLGKIHEWVEAGITEEEIAKKLRISYSVFRKYKHLHEALMSTLKKAADLNTEKVVSSLLQNALGGKVQLIKQFKLKRKIYDEKGRVTKEEEYLKEGVEETYVKPDVIAQMYWLNNRDPQNWKARQEKELINGEDIPAINIEIKDCTKGGDDNADAE